jgi:antibiotic biosynthesis monooxygenase (ABM) superfamily enzyme
MNVQQSGRKPLCRINKFAVPAESRAAFLDLMAKTHAVLRQQEGVVADRILEQQSGPGVFNFVALIEFAGPEVIDSIVAAVAAFDRQAGIDRQQAMLALNVKTDMGLYHNLEI